VDPTTGNDSGAGTQAAPLRTFERALQVAASGSTIVLRKGVYHEGRTRNTSGSTLGYLAIGVTTPNLTVQNYPGEEVWFDGSSVVTGFAADGEFWSRSWVPFRRDPTYSWYGGTYPPPNATDGNWLVLEPDQRVGWQFVDYANAPTAAWPERVWIDGVAQKQVERLSKMGPGRFFIDAYTNRLYLGENPAGKKVEVTDLQTLLNVLATDVTLRGFGVRRYAASNPQGAVVKIQRARGVAENLVFEDCSMKGLGLYGDRDATTGAHGSRVNKVTTRRIGNLGFAITLCDDVTYSGVLAELCNDARFFYAPSAGGFKMSRGRRIRVDRSIFRDNYGIGLWFDEDVAHITITNSDFIRNEQRDLVLELGFNHVVANCYFRDSGTGGLQTLNVESVEVWNCTFVGQGRLRGTSTRDSFANPRQISINADERTPRNSSSPGSKVGVDPRIAAGLIPAWPGSADKGWIPRKQLVRNSVFGHSNVQAYIGNEDYRKSNDTDESWQVIGVTLNGNVYNRNPATTTQYPWIMARGYVANQSGEIIATTLSQMRSLFPGLETNALEIVGASIVDSDGDIIATQRAAADAVAVPLPDYIANLIGQPTGSTHAGAWR
jgi:hypothetical protein